MSDLVAAILGGIVVWGPLIALCVYVIRTWIRWFRTETKLPSPKWRGIITTSGFAASTVSLATIIFLTVYASLSSSLTPYHPTAVLAYRIIFVTSLSALIAGIIGKGSLETPTFICSLLCLLVLVITAFAG